MRWSIAPKAGEGLDVSPALITIPLRALVCTDIGEMPLIAWRFTDPGHEIYGSGIN
jgi:hypothetical protein